MNVYSLSIHADYRCHNTGLCCSVGWDVPVELPVYRSLSEALERGALRAASTVEGGPFVTGPDLPEDAGAIFARTDDHACAFLDRGSRLCVVHRDLGEPALPSTCRHFPRVAVRDWRGTFITLSHFCPTAASMLFREDVGLEVVEAPPAFPPRHYEGLDVDPEAWPPLLRPRRLMDLDGYTAWERHMIARCADTARRPESIVATLARDARLLREWRPGGASLAAAIAALPSGYVEAMEVDTLQESLAMHAEVMTAVPDDLKPEPDERGLDDPFARFVRPAWHEFTAPLDRFVAAKAFACWTAYQGDGLLSIVRGLEAALAIVRVEAARQCRDAQRRLDRDLLLEAFRGTDFVLNHLAVGEDLAKAWSRAEHPPSGSESVQSGFRVR